MADGLGALGIVVEELHRHVSGIELLKVGQAELLEVRSPTKPTMSSSRNMPSMEKGLALEPVPFLEELRDRAEEACALCPGRS